MLQDFVGDFHATSRHQRQDAGGERIEVFRRGPYVPVQTNLEPKQRLVRRLRTGRLVNQDEPRRQGC